MLETFESNEVKQYSIAGSMTTCGYMTLDYTWLHET